MPPTKNNLISPISTFLKPSLLGKILKILTSPQLLMRIGRLEEELLKKDYDLILNLC